APQLPQPRTVVRKAGRRPSDMTVRRFLAAGFLSFLAACGGDDAAEILAGAGGAPPDASSGDARATAGRGGAGVGSGGAAVGSGGAGGMVSSGAGGSAGSGGS